MARGTSQNGSKDLMVAILTKIHEEVAGLRIDHRGLREDNRGLREDNQQIRHELVELRTSLNDRLDQTNQRLDQTNQRLDQTNQGLQDLGHFMRQIALDQRKHETFHAHHVDILERDVSDLKDRMRKVEDRLQGG